MLVSTQLRNSVGWWSSALIPQRSLISCPVRDRCQGPNLYAQRRPTDFGPGCCTEGRSLPRAQKNGIPAGTRAARLQGLFGEHKHSSSNSARTQSCAPAPAETAFLNETYEPANAFTSVQASHWQSIRQADAERKEGKARLARSCAAACSP